MLASLAEIFPCWGNRISIPVLTPDRTPRTGEQEDHMSEERLPESWVGHQIEAMIVRPNPKVRGWPLTALEQVGTLEGVNSMGMVASLWDDDPEEDPEEEPPVSKFYPWSTVLWVQSIEDE
jgi:hypothetical protein